MDVLKEKYTITELSECLNITDHALRYYEKEFSLKIPKDDRGRRYYTTETANVMYQIKAMRDNGLEIKAIRKILQSENLVQEPPIISVDSETLSIVPLNTQETAKDIKQFFEDFKIQLTANITTEIKSTREHISKEINRSKLELGACVENSVRKLESKMEKHFTEVDKSLGNWRKKNRRSIARRVLDRFFG